MRTLVVIVTIVVAGLACGPAPRVDRTGRADTVAALTGDAAAGKAVYDANCGGCHGAQGKGGVGKSLFPEFNGLTNGEVATVVLNGQGLMGAKATLSDQQIADLIAHGRATFR
ncbi:MAG: cytochrome c [Myxococcaceae bacterium]|nr:cytochrome c [Myxococcaceae bacterium]